MMTLSYTQRNCLDETINCIGDYGLAYKETNDYVKS